MSDTMNAEGSQSSSAPSEVGSGSASPATTSAPQSTPSSTPVEKGAASSVPPEGANAAPAWTPSFKFKAAGKEHEIPEYLRSVVKDAETEKQLKELHEKAYGLDLVKSNYQTSQQQLQHFQKTIMPQYDVLKKTVDAVVKFRDNKDLDSVFEHIGIPEQAIAQWMYQKIQAQELAPEQRALYEQQQQLRKENYQLQERLQNLSQTQEQYQLQSRANELQTALARPEVQQVADSYNARMAQPDAFWNFVCQQADYMERTSGQRVTADQAIQQSLRILGTSIVPSPVQGSPAPGVAPAAGSSTPPIIPNITGAHNSSPIRKQARSIDELRKLSRELGNA